MKLEISVQEGVDQTMDGQPARSDNMPLSASDGVRQSSHQRGPAQKYSLRMRVLISLFMILLPWAILYFVIRHIILS
ncbi:hypothetical protein M5E06_31455 [Azospirillum sp. A1-3]|uniref:hypothetical protein n=1 Tax=Azospirillum sp. A1-3 TaxID=185874 RepID=UPI00207790EC|nr:hypothetical protein [Azospirillum sp. A1-3]MCM8738631.1 hypothetical protein [Azospirillum sp. A1-3]